MVTLEIRLLGEFAMFYNGAPLNGLNGTRAQCLLAYLLLHRDAPVARQRLAFLFWPDSSEAQALTNLRGLLATLKQILPDYECFVHKDNLTVQWRADAPFSLDVDSFRASVLRAGSAEQLEAALALYSGDLLPECYDDWIAPERERLAETYRNALQRLVDLFEQQEAYPAAICSAQHLVRHDPLRENVWRQIMRLHALGGDRAGVVRAYRQCRTILKSELDVEPSVETEAAFEKWKRYVQPAGEHDRQPGAGPAGPASHSPASGCEPVSPASAAAHSEGGRLSPLPASAGKPARQIRRRTWRQMSPLLRLVWVVVLLLMAGAIGFTIYRTVAGPPMPPTITVRGCTGGSKEGLLKDPDVQRILGERYHVNVAFEKMGSRDMVTRCASGYDFAWPGTEADVERFRQALGPNLSYETMFNSALVLYSWADITDVLQRQGVVTQRDGVYYVADTPKLIEWLQEGKKFTEIGLPGLFGPVVIVPTDPASSESGGIFAVYLVSMLMGGRVPNQAALEQVLSQVHTYFDNLGHLEESTGALFDRFLRAGKGDKPIIVAYESQGLELIQREPKRDDILKKVRIIYPQPTVWISHPMIAMTPNGKALIDALKDPEIQSIAWKRHGFRSGVTGIYSRPEDQLPARVPETIESVMPLPQPAVMDRIVDALSPTATSHGVATP